MISPFVIEIESKGQAKGLELRGELALFLVASKIWQVGPQFIYHKMFNLRVDYV